VVDGEENGSVGREEIGGVQVEVQGGESIGSEGEEVEMRQKTEREWFVEED
jgi:hypothetical protein